MLGREVRGHVAGGPVGDGEARHGDPVGAVVPDPQAADAGDAVQSRGEPLQQLLLVARPRTVEDGGERAAGLRERGCAEDVGRARLVALRRGGPVGPVDPDLAHRAAAGQVRRGGVEPVAAPDQRAGPVGRVELVPGQRHVVDAGGRDVDAAVRGELRGVHGDPRPGGVGDRHDPLQRQHLAGHVRRAGDGDECHRLGRHRVGERGQRRLDGSGGAHHARRAPGQEVRVVLDVEADHPARHAPGQQVQRVGGVAGEHGDVAGPRPDEPRHLTARLLQDRGAHLRGVAGAAVHAGVVRQQRRDVRGDVLQRGCAGGEVEVGVGDIPAGDERDAQIGADHTGKGEGERHRGSPGSGTRVRVRACRRDVRRPGRHPEHPTAEEGCRPASRGLTLALMTWCRSYRITRARCGRRGQIAGADTTSAVPYSVRSAVLRTLPLGLRGSAATITTSRGRL